VCEIPSFQVIHVKFNAVRIKHMDLLHIEYIDMYDLVENKKWWLECRPDIALFREEGFPFEEWDAFRGVYCSIRKTAEEFEQHWIKCGAYDPVNKVWSEEKMDMHLVRAERGLAECLKRLRKSGQL